MKRIVFGLVVVGALVASYGLGRYHAQSRTVSQTGRRVLYYVDPMHPAYKSDKPGKAPDCGMDLEPVYADAAIGATPSSAAQLPPGAVAIDGATQQLLGIRVAAVERSGAMRTIRVVGRVAPEDTRVYRLNSGVEGFFRETHDDSVGMPVKKDQKLATYYSPEFLPAASGFLAATERVPGASGNDGARTVPFPGALSKQGVGTVQGYTDRLRNLGMNDLQIKEIVDSRQLPVSIDVYAPANGFVLARNISPGQHFNPDTEFYRIADLSQVWVLAEVFEEEAPYLRPGAHAEITLRDQARRLSARIAASLPQSEAGGGTVKLRLEADNPGYVLRPDMLVDVELPVRLPPAVTVPLDAVVDSGARARVYVERSQGVFEPREVQAGWRTADRVEIRNGLQPGERVVVAATFLVDSESRLKAPSATPAPESAPERPAMMPARMAAASTMVKDPNCGMQVDPAKATAAGNTFTYRGATYYFCSRQCKETFEKDHSASASRRLGDRHDD